MFQLSRSLGPRSRLSIEHEMTTRVLSAQIQVGGMAKVTHEEIIRFGTETSHFKQLHQIEKLSVNIAAYLTEKDNRNSGFWTSSRYLTTHRNWGVYDLNVAFFDQNFASLHTQPFNLFL
jgi:hypothetical protein